MAEQLLRNAIRNILVEKAAVPDEIPNRSTGINVLEDPSIREGIKAYSDWPTIPQLYVKGEFVGGCDIVKEMFEKGDLQKKFKEKNISYKEN